MSRYGYGSVVHSVGSVLTDSGTVLAGNTNRKYALFVNDSDTVLYLSFSGAAVPNAGIRLNANGGSYEMTRANASLTSKTVEAIHGGSGTKLVLVTEGM